MSCAIRNPSRVVLSTNAARQFFARREGDRMHDDVEVNPRPARICANAASISASEATSIGTVMAEPNALRHLHARGPSGGRPGT